MTSNIITTTEAFKSLSLYMARAKEYRIRNIFKIEVFNPIDAIWMEVGETGAIQTYEKAVAVASQWASDKRPARIIIRPNQKAQIVLATVE